MNKIVFKLSLLITLIGMICLFTNKVLVGGIITLIGIVFLIISMIIEIGARIEKTTKTESNDTIKKQKIDLSNIIFYLAIVVFIVISIIAIYKTKLELIYKPELLKLQLIWILIFDLILIISAKSKNSYKKLAIYTILNVFYYILITFENGMNILNTEELRNTYLVYRDLKKITIVSMIVIYPIIYFINRKKINLEKKDV